MTQKKHYVKPSIRRVRLDVKAAVLGFCNTSVDVVPMALGFTCRQNNCPTPRP
ncbi:MAG TPA: hypothetical protein PKO09_14455 [Anaerolineae bacterium]|nr:hypothetical protein [Anaerolineae bacterium]